MVSRVLTLLVLCALLCVVSARQGSLESQAALGEGTPCASGGQSGTCTAGACSGTRVRGLCPGDASITCCLRAPASNGGGSTAPKNPTPAPAQPAARAPWSSIGSGVSQSLGRSGGCRSLLAFGGYTYGLATSQAWVGALATRANVAAWGVDSLFAVKGPQDVMYDSAELATSAIARVLAKVAANTAACPRPLIIVAAHSSGAFVAHEFISHIQKLAAGLLPRMVYFNLDGGNDYVEESTIARLGLYVPVSAHSSDMDAHNYQSMKYSFSGAPRRHFIDMNASGSGCWAPMCLHMYMVNKVPYLPSSWSERDAYDFRQGHPVQADYFTPVAGKISALAK